MTDHLYRAFGLVLSSDRPLPGLAANAADPTSRPDVAFVRGRVAIPNVVTPINEDIDAARSPDGVTLIVRDVGAFSVHRGERVVVDPAPGASDHEVEVYILGTVMVAVLLQHGLVPFHSNGVVVDGMAFLVCGKSGAGKSTMAASFQAAGLPLLSDDVCALAPGPAGEVVAFPGIRRLKLWSDAIDRFGLGGGRTRPMPWTDGEKYEIVADARADVGVVQVGGIFQLEWADIDGPAVVEQAPGPDAVAIFVANVHRRRVADLLGMSGAYMDIAGRIARQTPVFRVLRGDDAGRIEEIAEAMIRRMRRIAAGRATSTDTRAEVII
jgi:hypothetical protein